MLEDSDPSLPNAPAINRPDTWGKHYSIEVVQHPIRARMCGFGDKDRRPLAPAAVVKMVVRNEDDSVVNADDVDISFFLVMVDLWSEDGKEEMNLVLNPSAADRHAQANGRKRRNTSMRNAPVAPPPAPASGPVLRSNSGGAPTFTAPLPYAYQGSGVSDASAVQPRLSPTEADPSQPTRTSSDPPERTNSSQWSPESNAGPSWDTPNVYPSPTEYATRDSDGRPRQWPSQSPLGVSYPPAQGGGPAYSPTSAAAPPTPLPAVYPMESPVTVTSQPLMASSRQLVASLPPRHTYTRTIVGPLSANASRLVDENRNPGIFFLFQDLSIRTEGKFRLRLRLVNIGAPPAPEYGASQVCELTAPVLAQTFTEPFTVYSAKRFPGVPGGSFRTDLLLYVPTAAETTPLSIALGNQGQKLPSACIALPYLDIHL
ncbi:hypothetical protein FISHEDRAFT_72812 [Fistulina hepatica ATCC 64428]|nr:hypothetical protein FISHEDRAFT_72812 [Fistulina hepatica ATCC 64428]